MKLNLLRTLIEESSESSSAHLDAVLNALLALSRDGVSAEEVFSSIANSYTDTYEWED